MLPAGGRRAGGAPRARRRPARAARSSSPARSACCSTSATPPAGSTPSRDGGRGAHGPMTGRIDGADGRRRPVRASPTLDPAPPALPRRPPHRRHARCCPGVMGMEALRRGRPRPAARLAASSRSRTSTCWRRSSSTATSRARSSSRALVRDGGDGTLVADCRLVGRRTLPGQGEQETCPLHRPRAAGARGAAGTRRRCAAGTPATARRSATTRSTASTSTARPTRCSTAPGATTATCVGRLAGDLPADHEPHGGPDRVRPRA